VMALQSVVSRNIDPTQTAIVTIGALHAGKAANVIPESAVMELSIRSFDPAVRDRLEQRICALVNAHVEGYGGAGKAFDWSRIPTNVNAHLVLSGGLTPANVGDGIASLRPRCQTLAVDVSSGVEAAKGIKDAGKIEKFVAAVRAADELLAKNPS